MPTCLLVADDLTGAADAGNEFAARGYATSVALADDFDWADDAVAVVDTDTRYSSPDEARAAVSTAIQNTEADIVYKKIDSTLRGNVGAEVDAALATAGADIGIVAPAFPAAGRTTACGYHLVDGALVTDSAAGDDPAAAASSPVLSDLFEPFDRRVIQVNVDQIAKGVSTVADLLSVQRGIADQAPVVVCDAIHSSHLDTIAGAAKGKQTPVYVGSAGLACHVRLDAPATGAADVPSDRNGPVLGIAGSVHPQTQTQVQATPSDNVVTLNAARAVRDPEAAVTTTIDRCEEVLRDGDRVLLTTARCDADVDAAREARDDMGFDNALMRGRIADAVAKTAKKLLMDRPMGGLFLTGGETSKGVLDALDVCGLRLTGTVVGDGVPVAVATGGTIDGMPLVTKAGAFGDEVTIVNCLDQLNGNNG